MQPIILSNEKIKPDPTMKNHTIKLIDGEFTPHNAKSLLLELLSQKINYHQKLKFSNEERFGKDPERSERKILELSEEKQQLIQWINNIDTAEKITIKGNIELEIISNGVSNINQ